MNIYTNVWTLKSILVRVDLNEMLVTKHPVDYDEIGHFRLSALEADTSKQYPGLNRIVDDPWDDGACHVISVRSNRILGSARIARMRAGRLPFSKGVQLSDKLNSADSEMGKFIVHPSARTGSVFLGLLVGCAEIYSHFGYQESLTGSIYSDVLIDGPRRLNKRTYDQLGFQDTGLRYFDPDYGFNSAIYKIMRGRRRIMFSKILNIYSRYVSS